MLIAAQSSPNRHPIVTQWYPNGNQQKLWFSDIRINEIQEVHASCISLMRMSENHSFYWLPLGYLWVTIGLRLGDDGAACDRDVIAPGERPFLLVNGWWQGNHPGRSLKARFRGRVHAAPPKTEKARCYKGCAFLLRAHRRALRYLRYRTWRK